MFHIMYQDGILTSTSGCGLFSKCKQNSNICNGLSLTNEIKGFLWITWPGGKRKNMYSIDHTQLYSRLHPGFLG